MIKESFKIYGWMNKLNATTNERLIFAVIYHNVDDFYGFKVGHLELAEHLGISKATVVKSINKLLAKNYIEKTNNYNEDGGFETNSYFINFKSLTKIGI
jgi:DNA-binding MarR family transcriptional regulator